MHRSHMYRGPKFVNLGPNGDQFSSKIISLKWGPNGKGDLKIHLGRHVGDLNLQNGDLRGSSADNTLKFPKCHISDKITIMCNTAS